MVGEEKTIQYTGTSVYLAIAAIVFACLFSNNSMSRLATMRVAYTLSALMAAFAGISGYFGLFPGAEQLFAPFGRALGMFKDPNVFGPFLIWPTLFIVYRMLTRDIRLTDLVVCAILLFSLLLSFSRGAWFHFAVSSVALVGLGFLTAPNQRVRLRIVALGALSLLALAGLLALLLSFDSIGEMFRERAQLIQSYDVGEGGRFRLQELALGIRTEFPERHGAVRVRARARIAAAQRLSTGLPGLWLDRRHGLSDAVAVDPLGWIAIGLRSNAMASLCDHRLCGVRW